MADKDDEIARDMFDPQVTICVWRYQDAPVGLWPAGSGDDAEWLALIPPRLARENIPWTNSVGFGSGRVREWSLNNGAIVKVGYKS